LLSGNPFDNTQYFQGILVSANDQPRLNARFSILSPHYEDPASGMASLGAPGPYFGLTDEASKINLNAMMIADSSGNKLYGLLMGLPNMTDPIANSIIYWLDPTATSRSSGADNTYYSAMGYQAKNGPINSIEELLLVQDVTPALLYGDDVNRNGIQDSGESVADSTGTFGRGWSQYLTIYSREPNLSMSGATRIYLNDTTNDLQTLYTNLVGAQVDTDLATFIVLARLYTLTTNSSSSSSSTGAGGTGGAGGGGAGGGPGGGGGGGRTTTGSLGSVQLSTIAPSGTMGKNKISSLYDLINASVTVTTTTTTQTQTPKGGTVTTTTTTTTVYQSPLSDTSSIGTLFPPLYDATTTSQGTQMLGRMNINTMPETIWNAIANSNVNTATAAANSGTNTTNTTPNPLLSAQQVEAIMAAQPVFSSSQALDPSFQCPVWLMTEAQIDGPTMKSLEPYITTYSQVYSFQSVGYFDGPGPEVRFEAVIDLNPSPQTTGAAGALGSMICYPRILYQRDISELGKGFNNLVPQQEQ
jgi:hypothetical protein